MERRLRFRILVLKMLWQILTATCLGYTDRDSAVKVRDEAVTMWEEMEEAYDAEED